ncbi:lipopolysaccharide biosynthesis protein [Nocardioides sp. SYSU D00038]|uniref:lipopolysaccharide biosynthesis protein n=1 Tax=Nocardioides sp. SYSU D00038 TaxID=2812554 RepID=UPI0019671209|nr:lipopolysaccharide biosynthesis protein [Nocardioides sp. SYSU D00038]
MTGGTDARVRRESGVFSPFRSLLTAQVAGAVLGLVFWILVARLVDAHEVGVAAAAISAQTLLGMVTVLGLGTLMIAELPRHDPRRQRRLVLRSLAVVTVSAVVLSGIVVAVAPLLTSNLREALGDPVGASTFVLGAAAAAWSIVADDSALGLKRSSVQVWRNLLASSLRFPVTALLLGLGLTDAHVLQMCWVLPMVASVPFALWRLRMPRGASGGPGVRADVAAYVGPALRNHALTLSLAAASQMMPVVAGLALLSVDNAAFAIAWQMATFVFLPPYLLATALFAHGANVSTEEFRTTMETTIPASLLLSALLCVGAWGLGEPVLLIFGGRYATESWVILALLAPAGLWMVFKDHLVALWRSQRRFRLATRLAVGALVFELAGAVTGAVLGGAVGLCLGWLAAMALEAVAAIPWLRQAFGGLTWRRPTLALLRRDDGGRATPQVVGAAALVVVVVGVGVVVAGRAGPPAGEERPSTSTVSCRVSADRPGPALDLGVQPATGDPAAPLRPQAEVERLVASAAEAGATVVSTSVSFRVVRPTEGGPDDFTGLDRFLDAARGAGLGVRLSLVGMPDWALDRPTGERYHPPLSAPELAAWADLVRATLRHAGPVDYVEVWPGPDDRKFWTTGPDPAAFAALLQVSWEVVQEVAPDAHVIAGGLIGNDIGYLERLYDALHETGSDVSPFDLLGVQPFSGGAPPEEVDEARVYDEPGSGLVDENFTGFRGLREVMKDNGDAGLDMYVSQFGYSTTGEDGSAPVADDLRAEYVGQALDAVTCSPYVVGFSWYYLHPTRWDPASWTLLDEELRPNLTYGALRRWTTERDRALHPAR